MTLQAFTLSAWAQSGVSAAAGAFESIATVTGNGSASSLTFSSISSDYTHLQIRGICRGTRSFNSESLYIRFNSDSGNNYSYHWAYGDAGGTFSTATTTTNLIQTGLFPGALATSNIMAGLIVDVLDYKNTNKNKTIKAINGYDTNGSGSGADFNNIFFSSGSWRNTNAITSITILSNGAFTTTTTFALYGIKGT